MPGAHALENEVQQFELVVQPARLSLPLVFGVALGMTLVWTLERFGFSEPVAVSVGLGWALVSATMVYALARRRQPDRVRVTRDTVELTLGEKVLRRVQLGRLSQVNELHTTTGPVLLLADHKGALALAQEQLQSPRAYEALSQLLVERMQLLDPTGERSRRAVQAGRLSDVLVQQPVRVAPILVAAVALASLLSLTWLQHLVASRPYPDIALGAFSPTLVRAGESWRLFSYVFVHRDPIQLALAIFGLFWFAPFVERLVGWERTVLAFVVGAAGSVAAQFLLPLPYTSTGATGGVVGLIGMLAALATLGRRRLPRALLPNASVWVAVGLYVLPVFLFGGLVPVLGCPAGLAAGYVMGALALAGTDLPPSPASRAELRPFAVLGIVALAIGLVGAMWHLEAPLPSDDEAVTNAYVNLAKSPAYVAMERAAGGKLAVPVPNGAPVAFDAWIQNTVAWQMLGQAKLSKEGIVDAGRIAQAAADATGRKDPTILDTLAVARYRAGDKAGATELLKDALRFDMDPQTRKVLQEHLDRITSGKPLVPADLLLP